MIQELSTYRNRHEVLAAIGMTNGANALDLQPLVDLRPRLYIPKPISELSPIVPIETFSKRKGNTVIETTPKTSEALARQQIIENTAEVEPERFIEREIDPDKPWSAFGQVMFVREHEINGKKVKKIAAISVAYPGGVGTRMAGEALGKTIGVEQSEFERWEGEQEGGIIAASKEVSDIMEQFGIMDAFIENSGTVIKNKHAQVEHEVVEHYFGLQDARRDFLDTVKEDAARILENPHFTERSAFDKRYEGKGIYLIEGIIEDGVWDGGDPQGKRMRLVDMAADDAHLRWLQWAEKTASAMNGDGIIVDAEDTETVHECGGGKDKNKLSKGCSAFFEKMEGELLDHNGANIREYMVASGIEGSIAASEHTAPTVSGGGVPVSSLESENCSTCSKSKYKEDGCKCSS